MPSVRSNQPCRNRAVSDIDVISAPAGKSEECALSRLFEGYRGPTFPGNNTSHS